jgi:ribosomal protein S27AE
MQNPMAVYNGQSWLFWSSNKKDTLRPRTNEDDRPNLGPRLSEASQVSKLTDERSDLGHSEEEDSGHEMSEGRSRVHCGHCGSDEFTVRFASGEKILVCGKCGSMVDEEDGGEGDGKVDEQNAYRSFYT